MSLGTFNTRADGSGLAVLPIPAGVVLAASAITDEPSGGSPQPTTSPFMVAAWKAE